MWTTWPLLPEALEVVRAWGFTYKTCGFLWAKDRKSRAQDLFDENLDFPIGTGFWTRANTEACLLGTRGHPKPQAHDLRQLIVEPRTGHSRKPAAVAAAIERLCAGPYLELFARPPLRPGWAHWGNEVLDDR
jgi:N6-adenosine-specific RNA methylase IME4